MVQGQKAKQFKDIYNKPLKSVPDDQIPPKYIHSPSNSGTKADISATQLKKVCKSLLIA
jgi:hypothetical protein